MRGRRRRGRPEDQAAGQLAHVVDAADCSWRKASFWAVDTFNGHTWNRTIDLLEHSSADFVLGQESHVADDEHI